MDGPWHSGGVRGVLPLEQAHQSVLKETAGGHDWQTARLVEGQQVAVIAETLPGGWDGRLLPGGAMPGQPIAPGQDGISKQRQIMAPDFAVFQAPLPSISAAVGITLSVKVSYKLALSGALDPVAIDPAAIKGSRLPAGEGGEFRGTHGGD
jgi:hypothetical protein